MHVVVNDNGNFTIHDDFGYDVVLRPCQVDELVTKLNEVKLEQEAKIAEEFDYESSEAE